MTYLSVIWTCVRNLFSKKAVGIVLKTLFVHASSATVQALLDTEVQNQAYALVSSLQDENLTSVQKAEAFNRLMKEWMVKTGRAFGTSILNAIRELAVAALKAGTELQTEKCEGRNEK